MRPVAPALLWSEMTSLMTRLLWRSVLSPEQAADVLDVFLAADIQRIASDDLYRSACDVAASLGWAKSYDAEYVALAQMLDAPLVTVDAKLRRGASRLVTVLTPDEALA